MPDISKAMEARTIDGATLTTGAEYMLLRFTSDKGRRHMLAVPTGQLTGLVMTASSMAREAARIKGDESMPAFAAESWRIGLDAEGELVMTMRLPGKAEVAYRLPKGSLDQLGASVEHLKGQATASAGETVN